MKITVLSKTNFGKLMARHGYNNENVEAEKDLWVISINNTGGDNTDSYFEGTDAKNVLILNFDDVDEDKDTKDIPLPEGFKVTNYKTTRSIAMNEDQGKEIISFMTKVKENMTPHTHLIVHCSAGVARSGSVGRFAADFLEYGQERLIKENSQIRGNGTVTRILNKLWLWSHYTD